MANEQESAELHVLLRSDIDQQADNIGGFLVDSSTTSYGWICLEWSQVQLHHALLITNWWLLCSLDLSLSCSSPKASSFKILQGIN